MNMSGDLATLVYGIPLTDSVLAEYCHVVQAGTSSFCAITCDRCP